MIIKQETNSIVLIERPLLMNEYTSTQSTEGTKQFC